MSSTHRDVTATPSRGGENSANEACFNVKAPLQTRSNFWSRGQNGIAIPACRLNWLQAGLASPLMRFLVWPLHP